MAHIDPEASSPDASEDEDYLAWLAFIGGRSTDPGASNPQNLLRYDVRVLQQVAQQVARVMAEDWEWVSLRATSALVSTS